MEDKESLLQEIEALKAENEDLRQRHRDQLVRADATEYALDEAKKKIEWYKGQIEAYQYCMNCRR